MVLLDTDVMVEVQKGRPEADAWLRALDEELALPAVVAWELLVGSRNKPELERTRRFLGTFAVIELQPDDSVAARDLILSHCLTTGLGLPDYLIAAQALTHKATLYTFNLRHFRAIADLDVRAPYTRQAT